MTCIVKLGRKYYDAKDGCVLRVPHGIRGAKGQFGSNFEF